jgi:hypothetical protein
MKKPFFVSHFLELATAFIILIAFCFGITIFYKDHSENENKKIHIYETILEDEDLELHSCYKGTFDKLVLVNRKVEGCYAFYSSRGIKEHELTKIISSKEMQGKCQEYFPLYLHTKRLDIYKKD